VIGGWYFARIVNRANIVYFFIAQGVGIIIWGFVCSSFYLSLIGSFFTGLFTTTIWAYTMTMLQDDCDDRYYGRVIAINDMLFNAVAGVTSLAIGAMASVKMGPNYIFFILASTFFVIAIYYKKWYTRYHSL
jgi:MFS family permease